MPKLPVRNAKDIIAILEKRGFILDRIRGSHHIYYHSTSNKRVVIPLHNKDLPKGTLMEILRQAGLTKEDIE